MLAGLLKKIAKAGGKANIKSEASAARNAVRKNPKMTGKKEDDEAAEECSYLQN